MRGIKRLLLTVTFVLTLVGVQWLGAAKTSAAGVFSGIEVETALKVNTESGIARYVDVKWSTWKSGSYLYRLNVKTNEEVQIGSVGSGGTKYYEDWVGAENGPEFGNKYKYRIGNSDGTDVSAYSAEIEVPNPAPGVAPSVYLNVYQKTFTIGVLGTGQLTKNANIVIERSANGVDGWKAVKELKAGTYEKDFEVKDTIDEPLESMTTYYYRAYYKNSYGNGPAEVENKKTEKVEPDFMSIAGVKVSAGVMKADLDVAEDIRHISTAKTFEVFINGKHYKDFKGNSSYHTYISVPLHYSTTDNFTVKAFWDFNGKRYYATKEISFKAKSKPLGGTKINGVTKINANQVGISWEKIAGAQGYDIYQGSKKVKSVNGKTNYFVYKKKGAGKGKYKVVAKIEEKVNGKKKAFNNAKKCKAVKPKENSKKFNVSGDVGGWDKQCFCRVSSVKLTGNTYTITAYAVNKRYYTCKKWKTLYIAISANGKTVAKKKFKNYALNLGGRKSKKLTFKIKGKSGADIQNFGDWSASAYAEWNE
ncbi:MAG: hypothetical protein K6G65_07280 [Lachnospiraceae bacterium]|nr:hypothetical protein [Lachnospiraceae bacterium]